MTSAALAALRRVVSPEAAWRRPDPVYRSMVARLSYLFAASPYELSASDRYDLARFYASLPDTATFIVLRTNEEASLQVMDASRDESSVQYLTDKVLARLFTEPGRDQLLAISNLYSQAKPDDAAEILRSARVLAVASVKVAGAVKQLLDYEAMVALAAELTARDQTLSEQPDLVRVWIAKHWQYCGARVETQFGQWIIADRMLASSQKVMNRLFGRDG